MLITVGLPFRNAAKTLPDTIRSVFAQSYTNWQLILIDDGSSDESLAIARSIKDPRVLVLSDGACRRLPARLNELAQIGSGELLARLDADDLMHPERLAQQVSLFQRDSAVDVVGTATYTVDSRLNVTGVRWVQPPQTAPATILRRGFLVHPTVTGRTAWFRRHPYDETLSRAQDLELWLRTAAVTTFRHLPQPLLFYRESLDRGTKDYSETQRAVRRIAIRSGEYGVPAFIRMSTVVASWAKQAIFVGADGFRLGHHLFTRRNDAPSELQLETAQRALQQILSTSVAGLPSATR